jgi:hypothetical protein
VADAADTDLESARGRVRRAAAGTPAWGAAVVDLLAALDEARLRSADAVESAALLDEAIELAHRYLDRPPEPSDARQRATVEVGLGVDLSERYQRSGVAADLDASVRLGRERVAAEHPSTWVTDRVNLAGRLLRCYDDRDAVDLLQEVVDLLTPAVARRDIDDEGRAELAVNLAAAHSLRYDRAHEIDELRRAIALYTLAVQGAPADEAPAIRGLLAEVWLDLYRAGEEPEALDRALDEARAAVAAPGSALRRAARLHALTHTALTAHDAGRAGALAEAAAAIADALAASPTDAPSTTTYLATSAAVDFERYLACGDRAALDAAIHTATDALARPLDDVHARAALANQACLTRTERFELDGDRTDLDTAIAVGRQALALVTRADTELPLRTNLANALQRAYELDADRALLVEGIAVITPAVRRTPAGTERAGRLNTAALLRASLARAIDSDEERDRAIDLAREALALTDPTTPEWAIYATNIAGWLADRSAVTGARADLDEAIDVLARAYGDLAADSALEARAAYTLGCRLAERYERFTAGEGTADLQEACDLWDAAAAGGEPFVRVFAGQRLGDVAFRYEMWDKCEQAMALALEAARQLTDRRTQAGDRERARLEVQGIAAIAAWAAVRDGRPAAAVVHLEQAAATLLAESAGFPADRATLADVVGAARGLGATIVYLATTVVGGLAIAVTPDGGTRTADLPVTSADVDTILDGLRAAFSARPDGSDQLAAWDAAARAAVTATAERVVDPLRELIGAARRVGLIPVGRPAWLPLCAALDADPTSACVARQLPNARTVVAARPWPRRPTVEVVGDPGSGERALPSVPAEMAAVAACYGPADPPPPVDAERRVLRGNARPDPAGDTAVALVARLGRADVAHIACHFDLDLDEPGASVLRLGSGIGLADLVARRFAGRPHIVLSACDAGLVGVRLPDEAMGPAPMLLHAGARSVLAALWPVDDALTVDFMAAYHARLAAGAAPADALSTTRRAMLGRGGHPAVWAAWSHTGP